MISSDWNQLQITKAELERVFEPNIIDELAIAFSSVLYFKHSRDSNGLLLATGSFFFISLLLLFPVNLIVLRQLGLVNNNFGLILVLLLSTCISILLLIVSSLYLYRKAKKIKRLTTLLNKVKQYNQIINSFNLLANISSIANSKNTSYKNTIELKSVLNLTKNTLLESIKLENFLYRHQTWEIPNDYSYNPLQLLAYFEDNLASLSFEETERNTEYKQLLEDAVDLSLSVRQEMRKICHLRQTD